VFFSQFQDGAVCFQLDYYCFKLNGLKIEYDAVFFSWIHGSCCDQFMQGKLSITNQRRCGIFQFGLLLLLCSNQARAKQAYIRLKIMGWNIMHAYLEIC
jgi:hypothetical protein